jgi:L-seryl-tRNA(Ser) seleniumtransferase
VAIKPPDLLNRLPSVSDLLGKPPVRALAERWNKSTVAAGVRSFLEELRNDLRRRAADGQLPSIRELAERAARYVVSQQQQSLGTAINATGRIWGAPWGARPLADSALERAIAVGREFVIETSTSTESHAAYEPLLCRLTGAQAALAVHSYPGALWLALSVLAADREVLLGRAEVGDLGTGEPLPKLAAAAKVFLKEVGTTNRACAADYEAAVSPRAAAILKLSPEEYRVVGETAAAELDELVALARDRELLLIDVAGTAPLTDPPAPISWPHQSARSALATGVDLVVIRGDGLVGGPACGIVLGRRDVVQRISEHPLCAASRLDAPRSAALVATLESYENSERGAEVLPVWQFLTTPLENLRNRAERIAPQLAQVAGVASAVAIETRSPISGVLAQGGGYSSYGVALTASDGNINNLNDRMRALPLPVLGRVEGDRLVLDLRTVLPRQDRMLVDAILGTPATNNIPTAPQSDVHMPQ